MMSHLVVDLLVLLILLKGVVMRSKAIAAMFSTQEEIPVENITVTFVDRVGNTETFIVEFIIEGVITRRVTISIVTRSDI
jgi:hypothetical protein